jgi:hypothetical protein
MRLMALLFFLSNVAQAQTARLDPINHLEYAPSPVLALSPIQIQLLVGPIKFGLEGSKYRLKAETRVGALFEPDPSATRIRLASLRGFEPAYRAPMSNSPRSSL